MLIRLQKCDRTVTVQSGHAVAAHWNGFKTNFRKLFKSSPSISLALIGFKYVKIVSLGLTAYMSS